MCDIRLGESEAALASANLALFLNERLVHIPGRVNDNGASLGLIILGLKTDQPSGFAILSDVGLTDSISAGRCGFRSMGV